MGILLVPFRVFIQLGTWQGKTLRTLLKRLWIRQGRTFFQIDKSQKVKTSVSVRGNLWHKTSVFHLLPFQGVTRASNDNLYLLQ